MVLLADVPYIAGRGTPVNVAGVRFTPEQLFNLRSVDPTSRLGGAYVGTGANPPNLGIMGGTLDLQPIRGLQMQQ
jgi:hypothetical protein